jgi:hypothetical protein
VAGCPGDDAAIPIHRMALRWSYFHRRDPALFRRQPADGRARQYCDGQVAECRQYANLRLDQWRRQHQHQYGEPGGNWPASYEFTPSTFQLDQAVIYFERVPDTVQTDHMDWGFRLSAIYGENYRYTTSYGVASYQLLGNNLYNGYDFPMVYGELYIPQVAEGLLLRLGRFISVPDIEVQLAPNNYMYTHSMTYTFDNYTNEGLQGTLALNKNWFLQLGVTTGTEAAPWHWGQTVPNPFPNPVNREARSSKTPVPCHLSRPAYADRATTVGTTPMWWPTPSIAASGGITIFSGRE